MRLVALIILAPVSTKTDVTTSSYEGFEVLCRCPRKCFNQRKSANAGPENKAFASKSGVAPSTPPLLPLSRSPPPPFETPQLDLPMI